MRLRRERPVGRANVIATMSDYDTGDTPSIETDPLSAIARPFSAVIFDCDGTLADTMPLHYRAWVETLAARGAEFSEQLFYDLGGVPTADIVRILNERFGY